MPVRNLYDPYYGKRKRKEKDWEEEIDEFLIKSRITRNNETIKKLKKELKENPKEKRERKIKKKIEKLKRELEKIYEKRPDLKLTGIALHYNSPDEFLKWEVMPKFEKESELLRVLEESEFSRVLEEPELIRVLVLKKLELLRVRFEQDLELIRAKKPEVSRVPFETKLLRIKTIQEAIRLKQRLMSQKLIPQKNEKLSQEEKVKKIMSSNMHLYKFPGYAFKGSHIKSVFYCPSCGAYETESIMRRDDRIHICFKCGFSFTTKF